MPNGTIVEVMAYDMENFLNSCIDRYLACTGGKPLKAAATPFTTDSEPGGIVRTATEGGMDTCPGPRAGGRRSMGDHQRYPNGSHCRTVAVIWRPGRIRGVSPKCSQRAYENNVRGQIGEV
jgi:hypothetical protein